MENTTYVYMYVEIDVHLDIDELVKSTLKINN